VSIPEERELEVVLIAGGQVARPFEVVAKIVAVLREVLASAVPRAIIRARGAPATLTSESVKASALARGAIAEATASTFCQSVGFVLGRWGVDPCNFVWALELRAVTAAASTAAAVLHGICREPILVARANVVIAARSVSAAAIRAGSFSCEGRKG